MPIWLQDFFDGISALDMLLWVGVVSFVIVTLVKVWPFISNAVEIVDALIALPDLTKKVDEIHHEVHYNNGSSVKDAVTRIEHRLGTGPILDSDEL